MTQRGRLAWLVGVMLTSTMSLARAEPAEIEPGRVVILGLQSNFPSEAWPDVEQQIAAELRVMGLVVDRAEAIVDGASSRLDDLILHAHDLGAVAGVVVSRDRDDVEIQLWLDDESTDLIVRRRLPSNEVQGPDAVSHVALTTAELLYASLLEINLITPLGTSLPATLENAVAEPLDESPISDDVSDSSHESEPTAPPPSTNLPVESEEQSEAMPTEEAVVEASPRVPRHRRNAYRFRARARLDVSIPFDPPSAMVAIDVGGGYRPVSWFVIDIDAQVTASPYAITSMWGQSNHYHAAFRASVSFEPFPRGPVRLGFGFGGGLLAAWTRGYSYESNYLGSTEEIIVGLMAVSIRLAIPISSRIRMLIASSLSFTLPRIQVIHARDNVANIGQPLLDIGVGVEWGLGRRLAENR